MGQEVIVTGKLILDNKCDKIIKHLSVREDDEYPWIKPEYFSKGRFDAPYYYTYPITAFAMTYKLNDSTIKDLILKMEEILNMGSFYSCSMQIETGWSGNLICQWWHKNWGAHVQNKDSTIMRGELFLIQGITNHSGFDISNEKLMDVRDFLTD